MKRIVAAVLGFMLVTSGVFALDFSGYLKTDWRMLVDGSGRFSYNQNDLDLSLKHDINSGAKVFAEMDLKNLGFATTTELYDLSRYDKTLVSPWTFEIKEAYIDLTGLFLKGLDVRIGKQRISWGTADRFNPTDNINPLDLSDVTDFGKRFGTNSIKATYYLGDCYFQGVYVPVFTPAVLPSNYSSLYAFPTTVPFNDTVVLPESNFINSEFALKAGGKIFGFDSSISYFYGYDCLPLDKTRVINLVPSSIGIELEYPKIQVIGLDAAGSIGDVGVWAEAGYFMPEQFDTTACYVPAMFPAETGTKLKDAYTKFTVGADYTFPVVGIYTNVQYVHGFFDERAADLKDYLVAQIERKFFSDKLKLSMSGFFEMDFKAGEHFFPSFAFCPEIGYSPFDATEIILGAYVLDSWANGKFYSSKDSDQMYLKVKYSF